MSVFSLLYDVLTTFSFLWLTLVQECRTHVTYNKIPVNGLFMLSVRLLIHSRLLVVKFSRDFQMHHDCWGSAPTTPQGGGVVQGGSREGVSLNIELPLFYK